LKLDDELAGAVCRREKAKSALRLHLMARRLNPDKIHSGSSASILDAKRPC
jgi:hypothetical protein